MGFNWLLIYRQRERANSYFFPGPATGPFVVESTPEPMYGYDGHQMANNVSPSVGDLHGNYTYDSHHSHPLTTPQPFAPSQTRGFSQPATGQAAPTYVYLSKADAQNPQVGSSFQTFKLSHTDAYDWLPLLDCRTLPLTRFRCIVRRMKSLRFRTASFPRSACTSKLFTPLRFKSGVETFPLVSSCLL